jgi:hypothetical protein
MAEILGLGVTHFPPLAGRDEDMARILRRALKDPELPERYRDPSGWPQAMREEWGDDSGRTSAARHRDFLVTHFRKARKILDDFRPDFVLVWGDDQYENFTEDLVPPFCLLAYDAFALEPWMEMPFITANVWGEAKDTKLQLRGHRQAGKGLAEALMGEGFDVAYAYRPLHHQLGHAFLNTVLYLDYDRRGFDHPLVPFQVNCYGRKVISQRAGISSLAESPTGDKLDPPSPMPWRCFDLGAACARVLARSPWRVALVASSSWSHAFLTAKNYLLYPDIPADRVLYEALRAADYSIWRGTSLSSIEESGQQEVLNWMCLAGAMAELGRRPTETAWIETHIFNSNKCFAYYLP